MQAVKTKLTITFDEAEIRRAKKGGDYNLTSMLVLASQRELMRRFPQARSVTTIKMETTSEPFTYAFKLRWFVAGTEK